MLLNSYPSDFPEKPRHRSDHQLTEFKSANFPSVFTPYKKSKDGFRFFSPLGNVIHPEPVSSPLRVMVITSLRDIAAEGAGQVIKVRGESKFFKGSLHALAEASLCDRRLKSFIEIASVVIDDVPGKDGIEKMGLSILPSSGGRKNNGGLNWIAPADQPVSQSQVLRDITVNIPSLFRKLPLTESNQRLKLKARFENSLLEHALKVGADLILSDHCILRFDDIHRSNEFRGKVLNIHPGITWLGDANNVRGLTPTSDMLTRAKNSRYCLGGASFHFISGEIDGGEVLCDAERTIIDPERDCIASLRYNNYKYSKVPVLEEGLRYYAEHLSQISQALDATYDR